MKKFNLSVCLWLTLVVTGCLDTVEETTVNEDGSGVFVSTSDLSSLISMAKTFAGDQMKDAEKMTMDTVINLSVFKDSLGNLEEAEKKLLEKATLRAVTNLNDEKCAFTFNFPYSNPADLIVIGKILKKTKNSVVSKVFDRLGPDEKNDSMGRDMMGLGSDTDNSEVNDYFDYKVEKGRLVKKLNKEMYAKIENDKSMQSLKEMSQMGLNSKMKTVIVLPRPVKKAEGKSLQLSDDKKTVTIETTLEDFFEDALQLEYEIEY